MKAAFVALAMVLALGGCVRERQQAGALVRGDVPVIAGSLDGGLWVVEDINGGGIMDDARVDMMFADGSVSGLAGCNRYNASWQQEGPAIKVGLLMTTRKMCAPALMDTERKFLSLVAAATMVSFDATGAALLRTADGRMVKIRRER